LAFGQSGTAAEMRRTTIDGTKAMVDAALAAGVMRMINVSTAAVYFGAPNGEVDESASRNKWGWSYSDEKLAAEEIVREATATRGLEGSIFQVAGVYGPWGETFVINPLRNMRRGIVVLPNHGRGIANLTYVDDVVHALVLGLKDDAVGQTFIIKGVGTITRREAYGKLEQMLGYSAVAEMSTVDVKRAAQGSRSWGAVPALVPAALRTLKASEEFNDAVRQTPLLDLAKSAYRALNRGAKQARRQTAVSSAKPMPPLIYPPPILIDYLAAEVAFSSEKAKRLLGYEPAVSLDEGMAITGQWAKWAHLIGPRR
jgi:nucleoside-diphosphate-sugar epimerase